MPFNKFIRVSRVVTHTDKVISLILRQAQMMLITFIYTNFFCQTDKLFCLKHVQWIHRCISQQFHTPNELKIMKMNWLSEKIQVCPKLDDLSPI